MTTATDTETLINNRGVTDWHITILGALNMLGFRVGGHHFVALDGSEHEALNTIQVEGRGYDSMAAYAFLELLELKVECIFVARVHGGHQLEFKDSDSAAVAGLLHELAVSAKIDSEHMMEKERAGYRF